MFGINQIYARLKGAYTVNPSIAASATNYKDPGSVASDLDSGKRRDGYTPNGPGVNGPVTIQISDGNYYTHLHLAKISGASTTNTITFTSQSKDSSKVVLIDSVFGYVVLMDHTGNISFNHMTFKNIGHKKFEAIIVGMDLENITISHNQVIGIKTYTVLGDFSDAALIYMDETNLYGPDTVARDSNVNISNNLIRNGNYSLSMAKGFGYGSYFKKVTIQNNIIDSFYSTGLAIDSYDSTHIIGNTIKNSISSNATGISAGGVNIDILKNKIYLPDCKIAINIQVTGAYIIDNFITVGGTGSGVNFGYSPGVIFSFNNVLVLNKPGISRCSDSCIALDWSL